MENKKNGPDWDQIFIYDGLNIANNIPEACDQESFTPHAEELYKQLDLLSDSFITNCEQENLRVDCKMGCSWCCYQAVFALTHEMLLIVNYIRKNFDQKRINEILAKAKKKSALTKELSKEELLRFKHPCPLLKNGVCTIYPVRPLACRIYLSSDVETCKARYNNPEDKSLKAALFGFMMDAGKNMNYGFVNGLKEKNLISNEAPLEWILEQFLENKDSFDEWLSGKELHENFDFEELA